MSARTVVLFVVLAAAAVAGRSLARFDTPPIDPPAAAPRS
jgi:hypothetical protein